MHSADRHSIYECNKTRFMNLELNSKKNQQTVCLEIEIDRTNKKEGK